MNQLTVSMANLRLEDSASIWSNLPNDLIMDIIKTADGGLYTHQQKYQDVMDQFNHLINDCGYNEDEPEEGVVDPGEWVDSGLLEMLMGFPLYDDETGEFVEGPRSVLMGW